MFKNKDGSYNKFQLIIVSLIAIIGIGIAMVSLIPDIQTINIDPIHIIIGFIIFILFGYIYLKLNKSNKISSSTDIITEHPVQISYNKTSKESKLPIISKVEPVSVEPVNINQTLQQDYKIHRPFSSPIKEKPYSKSKTEIIKTENYHSSGSGINMMMSMIITVVVAAATMMVGLLIVSSLQSAAILDTLPTNSPWSSTVTNVTENVTTAFNFVALGLFVFAAISIIGVVSGMMGGYR